MSSSNGGFAWTAGSALTIDFNANTQDEFTPVGVCHRPEGSVHPDGYIYLYFNKQGNQKSGNLYPAGAPNETRKVYIGRVSAPATSMTFAQRRAYLKNKANYKYYTSSSTWSSSSSNAVAINDTGKAMGKHFLVWYVPELANDLDFGDLGVKYVAAQTQNTHYVWLGYSANPWGPFTQTLNKSIDTPGVDNGKKFTAQLLPSPVIKQTSPKRFSFPLIFSGTPPLYDGFFIGKAVFSLI